MVLKSHCSKKAFPTARVGRVIGTTFVNFDVFGCTAGVLSVVVGTVFVDTAVGVASTDFSASFGGVVVT